MVLALNQSLKDTVAIPVLQLSLHISSVPISLAGVGLPGRAKLAEGLPQRLGSCSFSALALRPAIIVRAWQAGASVLWIQRRNGAVRLLGAKHPAQTRLTA